MRTNPRHLEAALDAHLRRSVLEAAGSPATADKAWSSPEDQGVYAAVVKAVAAANLPAHVAEDVVQDVVSGLSMPGGVATWLASRHRAVIAAGKGPRCVVADLSHHAYHRALSVARRKPGPDADAYAESMRPEPEGAWEHIDDFAMVKVIHAACSRAFADSPCKMVILEEWLRDPTATAVAIANRVGNLCTYEYKGGPRGPSMFRDEAELAAWRKAHPGSLVMATLTSRYLREIWEISRKALLESEVMDAADSEALLANLARSLAA